tara:strand:- start:1169 stop:1675 length:507 start_codon:yes stop_codon:yes gene_type:complete
MQQSKRKNSLLYLFLILFVFNSCSLENRIENKQRRAERKIEKLTIKYPQLLKQDTITDTLNVYIPEIKHDTSFIDTTSDTTYIYKDKLRIKYIRVGDTTYIEGECKSDTIIQTINIPVERIVVRKQGIIEQLSKNLKKILIYLFLILLLVLVLSIGWKFIKKAIWPLS